MPDIPGGGRESLPGDPISLWLDTTDGTEFDPLDARRSVDVAIVGGGIAGLTTAWHLHERGRSVAVLERDRLVEGVTGKTTAKVTSQHGLIYDHLHREFGRDRAEQYAQGNERAIEEIADRVAALGIEDDCRFERHPAYVYGDDRDAIEREVDAAQAVGLPASFVTSVPPFDVAECAIRFEDQAWFHPREYLLAMADELASQDGVEIYERTRVTDVDPGTNPIVETAIVRDDGRSTDERTDGRVDADHVVLATGFPILDRVGFFTRMYPKRSYVLAIRIADEPPDGMYYRSANAGGETYRSVRTYSDEDETLVLVGGENHKTGQGGSTVERYRRLARWAHERFPIESIEYRWSTQDYVTADRVPFVGRAGPGAKNVFVATGFGGWGMTGSTVAGRLLADLVDGRDRPEAGLYDPMRFTPKASIGDALTENVDAAGQFATDWLRSLLGSDVETIGPGEGRVSREGAKPTAVSRDENGDLHVVSAVCTHTYCVVDWNDGEGTWDCPCHGSRFDTDGRVLEGPATDDLSRRDAGSEPE